MGSSKLALVLVALVTLLALAGAMLPQEGDFTPSEIAQWQEQHPVVTSLLKPPGLFRVFHSPLFLGIVFLLGLNTLTCTFLHLGKAGGIAAFKGPDGLRLAGFTLLHLGLILLFAGGAWSTAARLDGYIVLTEGQTFTENHGNYLRLVEGPLRREQHKNFSMRLDKVRVDYLQNKQVNVESHIEILPGKEPARKTSAVVKINQPVTYRDMAFTQDQTGFSPRLEIRDRRNGRLLLNSFLALKTFRREDGVTREYRDFLPLPVFKNRLILTLVPNDPLLRVDLENNEGKPVTRGHIKLGESLRVEDYIIRFSGLRQWSAFRVVEDPGYPLVCFALWLGVGALIIRYLPDLAGWFKTGGDSGAS